MANSFETSIWWLIYQNCTMTHLLDVYHDSFTRRVPWLIYQTCTMTHLPYMYHDSRYRCLERFFIYICVVTLCTMTHSCVCRAVMCVLWLIRMCFTTRTHMSDMPHACVWEIKVWSVVWDLCTMTYSYVGHDSYTRMPWLIPIWKRRIIRLPETYVH